MMTSKTIKIYLNKIGYPMKQMNLIIFQFYMRFIDHVFLSNYTRLNIFIRILTSNIIIVFFHRFQQFTSSLLNVKQIFVFTNYNSTRIMCAFQDKTTRYILEIYIIKIFPNSQGRYYIFFANNRSYVFFYSCLINHLRIFRMAII